MPDLHILGAGLAPTPFTADEIRAGCPEGRTIRLFLEPAGGDAVHRLNRFVGCDEEGATLERAMLSPDGDVAGPLEAERVTWLGLQRHASFPEGLTTIEPATVDLPIGTVDCLRYIVRDGEDVDTFWFALAHPGMPVRYASAPQTVTMVSTGTP